MIGVISFEHHTSCMKPSGMNRKFIPSSIDYFKSIYFKDMILRLYRL